MALEGRSRLVWPDLPDAVAHLITDRLGEQVAGAYSHDGGYSPGLASTLVTTSGERVFVKATSVQLNEAGASLYRREAEVATFLGSQTPAPGFVWWDEVGAGGQEWVLLAFEAADGPGPMPPWRSDDVCAMVRLADRIGDLTAPDDLCSLAAAEFRFWHEVGAHNEVRSQIAGLDRWAADRVDSFAVLEDGWAEAVRGTALQHNDLRADNMVTMAGELLAVDWPYACAGAPWVDLVGMLPSMAGTDPEEVLTMSRHAGAADPDAVNAVIAALAGYFLRSCLQPAPPSIPHLRDFQRDQGLVCLDWLRRRLA